MIYSILSVQFTCLTFFLHSLCPSFLWSSSWSGTLHFILHTFLHPIVVLFAAHDHSIAIWFAVILKLYHLIVVSPSLFFSWNPIFSFNATHLYDHSHLCPLKCRLIFFSFLKLKTHSPEIGAETRRWFFRTRCDLVRKKSAPKINMDDAKLDESISSMPVMVISRHDVVCKNISFNHRSP